MHDANGQMASIRFPEDTGEFAFVVDGQHRLFSFQDEYRKLAANTQFELAVVAFHNATEEIVGATFVSINVNQKPVNRDLWNFDLFLTALLSSSVNSSACSGRP